MRRPPNRTAEVFGALKRDRARGLVVIPTNEPDPAALGQARQSPEMDQSHGRMGMTGPGDPSTTGVSGNAECLRFGCTGATSSQTKVS
jgi:hypothetical protein